MSSSTDHYQITRRNMIDGQILPNGVTDPKVIDVFETLPRELFVPPSYKEVAYADNSIPLGKGRIILSPMILARMFNALEVDPADTALVIGAEAGYAAAVMGKLAGTVIVVEHDLELLQKADERLTEMDLETVAFLQENLVNGYPQEAPYDVILVNGVVNPPLKNITEQLAEGGRMIALLSNPGVSKGTLYRCSDGVVSAIELFDAHQETCLPGFESKTTFVF